MNQNAFFIDSLEKEIIASEGYLRTSVEQVIYERLRKYFEERNKTINPQTQLVTLFRRGFTEADWNELSAIGFRMPMLQQRKYVNRILIGYLIFAVAAICWALFTNWQVVLIVWGLPIWSIVLLVVFGPITWLFLMKRDQFPCDTVDELVQAIVAIHWDEWQMNDRQKLKELVRNLN